MKAEFTVSGLYIGLLLAAIVLVGFTMFQADMFSNYGVTAPDMEYLNIAKNVSDSAAELKNSLQTSITGIAPLDMFIAGTYNALKVLFGVGDLYTTFLTSIGSILLIPAAIMAIIISAIVVVILFGIVSAVINRRI